MAVYTKTGDEGCTSLIGGQRVDKFDVRVEAYGAVDELQAHVALLGDMTAEKLNDARVGEWIERIVCELMTVESLLAQGENAKYIQPLDEQKVLRLEQQIDEMTSALPRIDKFTIPGGSAVCSQCHVARTVCRRAEREAVRASRDYEVDTTSLRYLNRLSDWLYTFGRYLFVRLGVTEKLWIP
ncbi:MAG: cob(I)yrinic acid a,c-diamide adenosyltransferase [Rikenellaceae bacterium]|nr:cob(I)yrinic acid a,c-diamide adenosyltransferase [Rikenellaceae bacterium]